jgi:DNA-binding NarL/FixJ family response regulator
MIKIIIAEDQILIQHALIALLNLAEDFEIIATANDGNQLLEHLTTLKPDIIIMDFKKSKSNGIKVTKIIDENMSGAKVISLSVTNHPFFIKEMIKNGAKGFLSKNCTVTEFYDGIRNVHNGKTFFCSSSTSVLLHDFVQIPVDGNFDFSAITQREIEIISFLSDGFTTREIADKLFISSKTVERHKSNILSKLKLRNTAQLVKVAAENGLLFS